MPRQIALHTITAALGIAFAGSATGGCGVGGQVRSGMGRYEVGNYHEAADACSEMSDREADMNEKAHVRYLVYCGLTQYRLGNRADAKRMLALGNDEYSRGRTGWLKPLVVDEMLKALDDLGAKAGDPRRDSVLSSGDAPAAGPDI